MSSLCCNIKWVIVVIITSLQLENYLHQIAIPMILAAYSLPVSLSMHLLTTLDTPLQNNKIERLILVIFILSMKYLVDHA